MLRLAATTTLPNDKKKNREHKNNKKRLRLLRATCEKLMEKLLTRSRKKCVRHKTSMLANLEKNNNNQKIQFVSHRYIRFFKIQKWRESDTTTRVNRPTVRSIGNHLRNTFLSFRSVCRKRNKNEIRKKRRTKKPSAQRQKSAIENANDRKKITSNQRSHRTHTSLDWLMFFFSTIFSHDAKHTTKRSGCWKRQQLWRQMKRCSFNLMCAVYNDLWSNALYRFGSCSIRVKATENKFFLFGYAQ